jgi:hypothetical protein
MRRRTGFAWALAGTAGLALLLLLACHPGFALGTSTGMSAPAPPAHSVESIQAAHFLTPQFEPHRIAVSSGFNPELAAVHSRPSASPDSAVAQPAYGPLYRRPPPSFS